MVSPYRGAGSPSHPQSDIYDLDEPLVYLSDHDAITQRQSFESIFVSGQTGSGKTSGSGVTFLKALLRARGRYGGLCTVAKPGEAEELMEICRQCGREQDVIRIAADSPWRFNYLDYWQKQRQGSSVTENVENIVTLLSTVVELVEGKVSSGGDQQFWDRSSSMSQRNATELLLLAQGSLSLSDIVKFVQSAPKSREDVNDPAWKKNSFCAEIIDKAGDKAQTDIEWQGYDTATAFWLGMWPDMGDKTRSSIEATFMSVADMLLHGIVWEVFSTTTNIVPEICWIDGKIIILDLPIQSFHQVGMICQSLFKYIWQRAILRRDVRKHPRPCFLFMDEFQNYVSSFDWEYFSVSRSARVCNIAMTQNLHSLIAKLGGGPQAQHQAYSLLGNMVTKLAHAQTDQTTASYMADIIAQRWQTISNYNTQSSQHSSAGGSQQLAHRVLPGDFAKLKKGGPPDYQVEGIITMGGRIFKASNDTWMKCVFDQRQP